MNKIHRQRLYYLLFFLAGLSIASALIFYALRQNMNVFLTPNQITTTQVAPDYRIRLGGLVKERSVVRDANGLGVQFVVTDFKRDITVRYEGILPDLFREGKGVMTEGTINKNGVFMATQVLAKHDENYMPKNVYEQLRKNQ